MLIRDIRKNESLGGETIPLIALPNALRKQYVVSG
jgi:hypothetical protein